MATNAQVKVIEQAKVQRTRRLPLPGMILVEMGQEVAPDTLLARSDLLPGDPYVLDMAQEFGVKKARANPSFMDEVMEAKVGDRVERGAVLARQSGTFGQKTITSPVTGVVEFISRVNHRVFIREDGKSANPVVLIPAAKLLDVWPRMLRMYTQVKEGDEVKQGQILAASPSTVSWDCAYASVAGTIEKICTRTGTITLVRKAKPTLVDAYISGKVTHIEEAESVEVTTAAAFVQGVFGIGGETYGRLVVLAGRDEELTADMITSEHAGCVVVGGNRVSLEAMQKALSEEVKAIVAGGVDNIDLVQVAGREITIGLTGLEEMALTVVLTEGFGSMPMHERIWDLLKQHEGTVVSVNGATQIRAGTIRPEVIVPLPDVDWEGLSHADEPVTDETTTVEPGTLVRVVSRTHYGKWGRIKRVVPEPVRLPTEASVYVVEIQLEDGQVIRAAETNIEIVTEQ